MTERNNVLERERMQDRGNGQNRENWGREREDWRENDRERESQYAGEERNRGWSREGQYGPTGGRGREEYGGEGRWREGRGYSSGQGGYEGPRGGYGGTERGYEGPRGYEGSRGFEGRGTYGVGERSFEGSQGYDPSRTYEGSRGGYEGFRGNYEGSRGYEGPRAVERHGDYGPGAFTRQFRGGPEYFGTGQRGYGTTWGGTGGYNVTGLYAGGPAGYTGGAGSYTEQGHHIGRGPKGYQRSDDRIREDICERLTLHPEIDAVEIEIVVKNGEVMLTGNVDRRDEKRMAEDVAEGVSGVKDVHNQLRAQQHHGGTAGQGSQANKAEAATTKSR